MSSSTSSFKNEVKVVCLVLLVLAGCEVVMRSREQSLSVDLKHIREIPAISQELVEGDGTKVLFLGNSLTRNGVDTAVLKKELLGKGVGPVRIERVFPDATNIKDWRYVFKHDFVDTGRLPDFLIICFATAHLQDDQYLQINQLARYFSSPRDIPQIFSEDVRDFDSQVEFILSALSASFTNRTRVRTRVLDALIPHYRESAQHINDSLKAAADKRRDHAQPTYQRLEQLMALARANGVRIVFVAMPQEKPYTLDPRLKKTVEDAGMTLVDCRAVEGLDQKSYLDEAHLNSAGANIFSRFLADQLALHFQSASASQKTQATITTAAK